MDLVNKTPIRYLSSGKLGDFIHQLSIINERHIQTGQKGILYITEALEGFSFGLQKVYDDTKSFVLQLPYIEDYQIHRGEQTDVCLSSWRRSHLLFRVNWHHIFQNIYNVNWGSSPWLFGGENPRFRGKTLFSCSTYEPRYPRLINFKKLFETIGYDNIMFITNNESEYDNFTMKTGEMLDLFVPKTIDEFITAVNSCDHFIGNLSSPLTYAFGLHKKCTVLLAPNNIDNYNFINLEEHLPYINFMMQNE